jgi:hypothetical protein
MKPEWIAIFCTAGGMLAGFIATVSIMSYRTGRIVKEQESMKEKLGEMNTCMDSYRTRHETEHKSVDDGIHCNRREIGEVKTLAAGLDEWMKRLDGKFDNLIDLVAARGA